MKTLDEFCDIAYNLGLYGKDSCIFRGGYKYTMSDLARWKDQMVGEQRADIKLAYKAGKSQPVTLTTNPTLHRTILAFCLKWKVDCPHKATSVSKVALLDWCAVIGDYHNRLERQGLLDTV